MITTIEVTLSRVITDDGHMIVQVVTPEQYNVVEILGLLEAAKFHIYRQMEDQ